MAEGAGTPIFNVDLYAPKIRVYNTKLIDLLNNWATACPTILQNNPDFSSKVQKLREQSVLGFSIDLDEAVQITMSSAYSAIKSANIHLENQEVNAAITDVLNGPYPPTQIYQKLAEVKSSRHTVKMLESIPELKETPKIIGTLKLAKLEKAIGEFLHIIENPEKEAMLQGFLEKNPIFINPSAKTYPKQNLGDDFKTDLVMGIKKDIACDYIFIELEKVTMPIFTKNNDFSHEFNHAFMQVVQWANWIENDKAYLKNRLPRLRYINYLIIGGRSREFDQEKRDLVDTWNCLLKDVKFMTYDDILCKIQEQEKNLESYI